MILIWILSAVAALIALLVYVRHMAQQHVATLFRSSVRKQMAEGAACGPAMHSAISKLLRRPPFNLIKEEEASFLVDVLQDLGSPVDVGAEILQKCESAHNPSELRDRKSLLRVAYSTDLRFSLRQMIQNARTLHRKVSSRYPNITVALLASLSVREGWTFAEEQSEALIFRYRQKEVRVPKQGSGKDAARLILLEELAQRDLQEKSGTGYEDRKAARQEVLTTFDTYYEEAFHGIARGF
jgi:hypothetical protein